MELWRPAPVWVKHRDDLELCGLPFWEHRHRHYGELGRDARPRPDQRARAVLLHHPHLLRQQYRERVLQCVSILSEPRNQPWTNVPYLVYLVPDLSIRILAVSYAGAVEGSKAAFHLGRGCGDEKRTVLPSNGLSRERAEHPERAPNGFPGEAPPQNALEIFR